MKKIKKTDLRIEKEVIIALTGNDLETVKGGTAYFTNDSACKPNPDTRVKCNQTLTPCTQAICTQVCLSNTCNTGLTNDCINSVHCQTEPACNTSREACPVTQSNCINFY